MEKLRILLLTHQFVPRHVGGVEFVTRGVARRLVEAGHSPLVLTCHESPSPRPADWGPHRTEADGIPVTELHFNLSLLPRRVRAEHDNPLTAGWAREELRRFRPHLVHAFHSMKLSAAVLRACREEGIPIVHSLCDFWFLCPRHILLRPDGTLCRGPRHPFSCVTCFRATHGVPAPSPFLRGADDLLSLARRPRFLRRELLACDRILAGSPFLKRMFVENGYPAERLEVVPHGPTLGGPVERSPVPPPPMVLFLGSLIPQKGPHVLIEAFRRVPRPDARLRLVGPLDPANPYHRRLQQLAEGDDRITFAGPVPQAEVRGLLAEARLLAMPALWWENSPLVVKEAHLCGVPVAVSDLGSLSEMVTPALDGWRVPPGDVAAWAETLGRALEEAPSLRPDPTRVPTADTHFARVMEIYRELLERR